MMSILANAAAQGDLYRDVVFLPTGVTFEVRMDCGTDTDSAISFPSGQRLD